ncbi:MAG: Rrf2 family transcriptional regulator [Pirellulaceae bacterium]
MKMSRTVSYAVNAMVTLARTQNHVPIPCRRLAAEGEMPERFLLQILRNLVTHGILRSTRGVDGGYMLIRSPEDVSLLELIEAIEGPIESPLPAVENMPKESQKAIREALASINDTTRSQLESIKLAHLLPPPSPNGN